MKHVTASENWLFEIKAVRAIKTMGYGEPYSAIASLNIVDGELHIEGLLSCDKQSHSDLREIEQHIKKLGFDEYSYIRYKNGERIKIIKVIK